MDESKFRQEAYRMLRLMGYWPIRGRDASVCPRCHSKILPPIGRPDIIVLAPHGINRVLETKFVNDKQTSFAFSEISTDQREWMTNWMNDGGIAYIGIGVQTRPASFYIIDWGYWLQIEEQIVDIQASIPIDVSKGKSYRKEISSKKLDLVTLASRFKLNRVGGEWQAPPGHSLLKWREIDEYPDE